MSDIEKKMSILIDEANANYNASRFKDAARTFEHLISLAIQNIEPEEAIYFAYRAADCWKKEKNDMNRVLIFKDMAKLAFNFSSQIADNIVKTSKKQEDKAKALDASGECLLYINPTEAKQKLTESIKISSKLAEKARIEEDKINFLLNALVSAKKLADKKLIKELQVQIANRYVTNAEAEVKKGSPENLQIALRAFEDALEIYNELKLKEDIQRISKKIKILKAKVAEYDPFAT
ncbi:MAG: hypothetical protein H7647_05560 [Candidatus Heimdallarchaeota archaeon]|nr:hypothetical protein [Candidatus Heimdallarchaeota archaeon]MCK4253892.1 hypothetical protein [Candidatus Heimdallarchaeota archaeon]